MDRAAVDGPDGPSGLRAGERGTANHGGESQQQTPHRLTQASREGRREPRANRNRAGGRSTARARSATPVRGAKRPERGLRRRGPGPAPGRCTHTLTRAQPPPSGPRRGGTRRGLLRLPPRSVSAGSSGTHPSHTALAPRPVGTHSAAQRWPMAGGRAGESVGHWMPRVSVTRRSANGRGSGRAGGGGAGVLWEGSRHARDVQGAAEAQRGGAGGSPAHLHVPPAQPAPSPRRRRALAGRSDEWAEGPAQAAARGARHSEVRHAAAGPVFPPVFPPVRAPARGRDRRSLRCRRAHGTECHRLSPQEGSWLRPAVRGASEG